ncbi:ATP-binding protein [[Mycoplasma] mobile]|uniref:Expressed protein n=1 Tax=Mycoplasma mobile (strain ATCC 43663 / 163K / NCTC 11711) TaxID=267748 RepID=Q6KHU9_MYCM1|nr:ATP-binding protein [[Mycoplasma] mobile]AAT27828.1 expressed protein [Mycoplasma mobile 163K]
MQIKKISFENVKVFNNLELEWNNHTGIIGIIGQNSSGKTIILETIELVFQIMNMEKFLNSNLFSYQSFLNYLQKDNLGLNLISSYSPFYIHKKIEKFLNILFFDKNKKFVFNIFFQNGDNYKMIISNQNENVSIFLYFNEILKEEILNFNNFIRNFYLYYFSFETKILNSKEEIEKIFFEQNKKISNFKKEYEILNLEITYLAESRPIDISNFNNRINYIFYFFKSQKIEDQYKKYKEKFLKWMKISDAWIDDFEIQNDFYWYFKNTKGELINWNQLSKGTQKWAAFFYDIISRYLLKDKITVNKNIFFLIDEIENFMHLKLTKTFIDLMIQYFENNLNNSIGKIHLIYTTHQPLLFENLNLNEKQNIYFLEKHQGYSKIKKYSSLDQNFTYEYLEEKIGTHPLDKIIDDFLKEMN